MSTILGGQVRELCGVQHVFDVISINSFVCLRHDFPVPTGKERERLTCPVATASAFTKDTNGVRRECVSSLRSTVCSSSVLVDLVYPGLTARST